jgi:CheY-like chemotaxis protein
MREENEQRRKAQEQAELANETKNRFLATISHEVRTPINAIIGFCDLAINPDVHDDHQTNLRRVKDSSEHLLALIKDIIDYAQIESGKLELKKFKFDIYQLIESIVNAYYLDATSKKIKITCSIDKDVPKIVIGDSDAVRQILYNLIGNAIKFTDKGSVEVLVKLEKHKQGENKVVLKFSVKDTGIGISKLKQKLIFMDFTQGNGTSSSRRYGGVGLGLTICKYFVELMDGKISVNSKKDKGSEFEFTIQLDADTDKAAKKVIKKKTVSGKLNILVVEDNLLNSQVVTSFLKRLGHNSDIASNGKIALEKLAAENYDVVLMDIEMPEMDGIEATREIRSGNNGHIKNPKIPIIALTAHALRDYEEISHEVGMDYYLTKPIDIDRLSEALQSI